MVKRLLPLLLALPMAAQTAHFYPLTPCRVVDTRNPSGPLGGPAMTAGTSRSFPLQSGSCGIPSTAQSYSLNITALPHATLNYLTIWATGQTQPATSTINAKTGQPTANGAIVTAGTSGAVSVFVSDDADVILDINGYFAPVPGVVDATALYPFYSSGGFNDLGQAINAAISQLPASALSPHAGLVTIGAGIFYDSTTIHRPQQVTIQGSGNGTLIVFLPTSGQFSIDGDGISSAGNGGWKDLRLQGPNNSNSADAFFLGGDPAGVISPSTNQAPFTNFDNVEIGYFRDGIRIGNNVWDIGFTKGRIHDNAVGAQIETGATNVGEVLGFYNSVIYNNSSYGLYAPGGQLPFYGWTSVGSAFDYNGNGTQAPIVGSIRSTSSHFEQNKGPIWDESLGGQVIDNGSSIVIVQASPCVAKFDANSAPSTFLSTIGKAFATVTAFNCTSGNYHAQWFNNTTPGTFPTP